MTCVPPSQRSTSTSSTRSALPASTRSPSRVSADRQPCEDVAVAQRRRRRQRRAFGRLDERARGRERAVEPGVADERPRPRAAARRRRPLPASRRRRLLLGAPAARFRRGRRPAREAPRAGAAAPAPGRGARRVFGRESASAARVGSAEGIPGGGRLHECLGRRCASRRPEALELSAWKRCRGTCRRRSARASRRRVRERERVDELELVVEVVLEPEHDWAPALSASRNCSSRRSSDDRISRRLPQPHSDKNEARSRSSFERATACTGPSWRTSFHDMTAPPSPVWRSVLPALSPFVTCRGSALRFRGRGARGTRRRRCSGRASRKRSRRRARALRASAAGRRCAGRSRRSWRPCERAALRTACATASPRAGTRRSPRA